MPDIKTITLQDGSLRYRFTARTGRHPVTGREQQRVATFTTREDAEGELARIEEAKAQARQAAEAAAGTPQARRTARRRARKAAHRALAASRRLEADRGPAGCPVCGTCAATACGVLVRHLENMRLRGLSAGTVYSRKRALIRMGRAIRPVAILHATPADLMAWRKGLTLTGGAVVGYVSHAKAFYIWAVDEGLRADNPAARLPVPKLPRLLPRPISEASLMEALDSAGPRVRLWIVLAAWCGLRACEIAYLRRECILDTADPPALVIREDATKGRRERVVPLSPSALAELLSAGLPRSGYAFRRLDGQPGPNTPALVSKLANECLHDAGIDDTLHQLRHRFGTMTYRASRDLRAVQEMLGHASPATTAGYAAFDQPVAIAAVTALPAVPPAPGRLAS